MNNSSNQRFGWYYKGMLIQQRRERGFSLIEILVVVAIVGILTSILFANFNEARKNSRDKIRKSDMKTLQLAIELYKSQNGRYPAAGCGAVYPGAWASPGPENQSYFVSCEEYIVGLVPDYIAKLPTDPNRENETNLGYIYSTDAGGTMYKVMVNRSVESLYVTSFSDEFARCPRQSSAPACQDIVVERDIYAVYSAGAEEW